MNAEERKKKLKDIQENDNVKPSRTGIPIMYHGKRQTFDAYDIPLEYLVYNPYNGRIGSVVKSFERQSHVLNPENKDDVKIIEKFLMDSKPDANKITRSRLLKEHQEKHGIVTSDGVIIDGNRRAMLLNDIMNDDAIAFNDKQHCRFFTAIILPGDVQTDKKEILALETTYQMGEDSKLDYNPIEKYLKAKDLLDASFSTRDIAEMMGTTDGDVKMYLSVLKLMEEYLDEYGYTGMYTQLEKNEDSFQKLDSALKKYKSGVPSMWDYDPAADVSDLKLIAFDYIRSSFEQTLFRNIINTPTSKKPASSFFAKKDVWESFRDRHFDITKNIREKSVEDIQKTNPPDLRRALKQRDQQWEEKVEADFDDNYNQSMDKLTNQADAAKPLMLLIKACQALDVVDTTQDSFLSDSKIKGSVEKLDEYVKKFKNILGMESE